VGFPEKLVQGADSARFVCRSSESQFCTRVREADVIELHFIEAGLGSLDGYGDVVLSHLRLIGIGPSEAFAVLEEGTRWQGGQRGQGGWCRGSRL